MEYLKQQLHIKDRNGRTQYIVRQQSDGTVYCTPNGNRLGSVRGGITYDSGNHILADKKFGPGGRPELILQQLGRIPTGR